MQTTGGNYPTRFGESWGWRVGTDWKILLHQIAIAFAWTCLLKLKTKENKKIKTKQKKSQHLQNTLLGRFFKSRILFSRRSNDCHSSCTTGHPSHHTMLLPRDKETWVSDFPSVPTFPLKSANQTRCPFGLDPKVKPWFPSRSAILQSAWFGDVHWRRELSLSCQITQFKIKKVIF